MAKEYIDRKAAVAALIGDETVHIATLLFAQKRIEAIPAADVVGVKYGRWIEREDMYYGWNIWECSLCREEFCVEEGTPLDNEYNYCPNCGAKMEVDGK